MEQEAILCPTCHDKPRLVGHHPAVRVIELAEQLRANDPNGYAIVDQIKRQWKKV